MSCLCYLAGKILLRAVLGSKLKVVSAGAKWSSLVHGYQSFIYVD